MPRFAADRPDYIVRLDDGHRTASSSPSPLAGEG